MEDLHAPVLSATSAHSEPRRLSDLLQHTLDGISPVTVDLAALRDEMMATNPLLYVAHRNVQVRTSTTSGGENSCWRADLVDYGAGQLADGQPVRSVGHWNHPDQVELFEVTSGCVLMLIGHDDGDSNEHFVSLEAYQPGELAIVPPGWFHLTWSPWKPSSVFNIYTMPGSNGKEAEDKYRRRPPLPFTLGMHGTSPRLLAHPPGSTTHRLERPDFRLEPSSSHHGIGDLRRLLADGTDEQLGSVQIRAGASASDLFRNGDGQR